MHRRSLQRNAAFLVCSAVFAVVECICSEVIAHQAERLRLSVGFLQSCAVPPRYVTKAFRMTAPGHTEHICSDERQASLLQQQWKRRTERPHSYDRR